MGCPGEGAQVKVRPFGRNQSTFSSEPTPQNQMEMFSRLVPLRGHTKEISPKPKASLGRCAPARPLCHPPTSLHFLQRHSLPPLLSGLVFPLSSSKIDWGWGSGRSCDVRRGGASHHCRSSQAPLLASPIPSSQLWQVQSQATRPFLCLPMGLEPGALFRPLPVVTGGRGLGEHRGNRSLRRLAGCGEQELPEGLLGDCRLLCGRAGWGGEGGET